MVVPESQQQSRDGEWVLVVEVVAGAGSMELKIRGCAGQERTNTTTEVEKERPACVRSSKKHNPGWAPFSPKPRLSASVECISRGALQLFVTPSQPQPDMSHALRHVLEYRT